MPTQDLDKIYKSAVSNRGNFCTDCENVDKDVNRNTLRRCPRLSEKVDGACKAKCRGFKSITLKSVLFSGTKFRDSLISTASACSETEICTFVNAFDDLQALFLNFSPEV
jgi:hypothetical protein